MYNKHNLEVYKVASKNAIKPELASVAFYGNKTVATDSFRLIEVSAGGEAHEPILIRGEYVKRLKLNKNDFVGIDSFPEGRISGTFPDYESILAKEEGRKEVAIKVNGKLLGEVLLQLAKINEPGMVTISVDAEGKPRPIIITADSGKNEGGIPTQTGRALVMPIVGR